MATLVLACGRKELPLLQLCGHLRFQSCPRRAYLDACSLDRAQHLVMQFTRGNNPSRRELMRHVLVFLATVFVAFERTGLATIVGGVGMWLVARYM
jgi:hypothetical protein